MEHSTDNLRSVKKVKEELAEVVDELSAWASKAIPPTFFIDPDHEVVTTQGVVARFVNAHPRWSPAEKAKFLAKADPWIVAQAIVDGRQIITFEDLVPDNSTKVKIPNVAANFGVVCTNLYDVIEASGAKFKI